MHDSNYPVFVVHFPSNYFNEVFQEPLVVVVEKQVDAGEDYYIA